MNLLRSLGHLLPDMKYVRSIAPRILRPLYNSISPGAKVVDVCGSQMLLDPLQCIDSALYFTPTHYDRLERDFVTKNARSGLFLDVGANIGFWSLYLSKTFPKSRIVAVEANPRTAKLLQDNVDRNGASNIVVVPVGVGAEEGTFPLFLNETFNRGGDTLAKVDGTGPKIDVKVARLSSILARYGGGPIEMLKIDVEGNELPVFEDIRQNMAEEDWPKIIVAETLHSSEISDALGKMGYLLAGAGRENGIFVRSRTDNRELPIRRWNCNSDLDGAPAFTVFTPTYNRAHTLERLAQSLALQTDRSFEWLIIDDGSDDRTAELIEELAPKCDFPVVYLRQANAGKHSASNRAAHIAKGRFFYTVDSDDALLPNALEDLHRAWRSIAVEERDDFAGVVALCCDELGNRVGDEFPESPLVTDSAELNFRHMVAGEKSGFTRTDIIRAHPFPVLGAGFIPEGRVWLEIAKKYKILAINTTVRCYFQDSGATLSKTPRNRRALGDYEYYNYLLGEEERWLRKAPMQLVKSAIAFQLAKLNLGRPLSPLLGARRFSRLVNAMLVAAWLPARILHLLEASRVSRKA